MAIAQGVVTFQILDSRGEVSSYDQPFQYDNATATLAQIVSWVQGLGASVDLITDGQITKLRVSLLIPLPSGIKTAPVSGSDNEKTGLTTFLVTGSPNAYGDDVPNVAAAILSGNQIDQSNTNWLAWVAYLTTAVHTIIATDRYNNVITNTVKHAVLTFRKHRRALRRA